MCVAITTVQRELPKYVHSSWLFSYSISVGGCNVWRGTLPGEEESFPISYHTVLVREGVMCGGGYCQVRRRAGTLTIRLVHRT